MKKIPPALLALRCCLPVWRLPSPAQSQTGWWPYSAKAHGSHQRQALFALLAKPAAAEPKYNTWSWTPQIEFQILGPVPGGSQWMFESQRRTASPGSASNSRPRKLGTTSC